MGSTRYFLLGVFLIYILILVNLLNFFKGGGGIASSSFILFFHL